MAQELGVLVLSGDNTDFLRKSLEEASGQEKAKEHEKKKKMQQGFL